MKHLEDELKEALRRVEPSAGFAERVVARIEAPSVKIVPIRKVPRVVPAIWAAAAAGLIVFGSAWAYTTRTPEEPVGRESVKVNAPVPVPVQTDVDDSNLDPAIPPDLDNINRGRDPVNGWPARTRPARRATAPVATSEERRAANDLRTAIAITRDKLATARRASQTKIEIPAT